MGTTEPAVGPGGEVYVSWQNFDAGQVRLNRNQDFWGGGAWGGDIIVATPAANLTFYRVPAQPNRGVWNGPVIEVRAGGAGERCRGGVAGSGGTWPAGPAGPEVRSGLGKVVAAGVGSG